MDVKGVNGIRNDRSPERFDPKDLLVGTNVELDETGKISRRLGVTQLLAGSAHSLFASGDDCYLVRNGVLSRLNADGTTIPIMPVAGSRVTYCRVGDGVLWSDGLRSGVLTGASNRQWGIDPPASLAAASAGGGALRDGDYLYTMTYVRDDGVESGAPICGRLTAKGGINFTGLPVSANPKVTSKRIYLSTWNGELPYLAATVANAASSITISSEPPSGPALRTQFMGAAPSGQVVGYYNGRSYVADGRFLYYSQPYEYELFDLVSGYIAFSENVQMFAAVTDGIFVGTDREIAFLRGSDPSEFQRQKVADYGAVLGTEQEVPDYYALDEHRRQTGKQIMWMSKQGVCLGGEGGSFRNLTGERYILPDGLTRGASLLKVRGGSPQLIVSLFK
jgi:hypothetical protein